MPAKRCEMRCTTCRQELSQALDDDRPPSREAVTHMQGCPRCAVEWSSLRAVCDALGAAVPEKADRLPPQLQARIMAEVRATQPESRPQRFRPRLWRWAAAVALVAAGWLVVQHGTRPPRTPPSAAMASVAGYGGAVASWMGQSGRIVDEPLSREMACLATDVEEATHFLFRCVDQAPSRPSRTELP
jgi:hypothetical protein